MGQCRAAAAAATVVKPLPQVDGHDEPREALRRCGCGHGNGRRRCFCCCGGSGSGGCCCGGSGSGGCCCGRRRESLTVPPRPPPLRPRVTRRRRRRRRAGLVRWRRVRPPPRRAAANRRRRGRGAPERRRRRRRRGGPAAAGAQCARPRSGGERRGRDAHLPAPRELRAHAQPHGRLGTAKQLRTRLLRLPKQYQGARRGSWRSGGGSGGSDGCCCSATIEDPLCRPVHRRANPR